MAAWFSSKLKEAEQFLQQIDQQAAESLGKSDKQSSIFVPDRSEETPNLKAKHASDNQYLDRKFTPTYHALGPGSGATPTAISKFSKKPDNAVGGINGSQKPKKKDPNPLKIKQETFPSQSVENLNNIHKDDWTNLLSSPNTHDILSPALASSVGSSDSGSIGFSKGRSSKLPSNPRNLGRRNLPLNGSLLPKGILQPDHPTPGSSLALSDSVESIKPTYSGRFRDDSVKKRLEVDLTRITRDSGVLGDPNSRTDNNIHLNGHQMEMESTDSEKVVNLIESKEIPEIGMDQASVENGEATIVPSEIQKKQPILQMIEENVVKHYKEKEHHGKDLVVSSHVNDANMLSQIEFLDVSEVPNILKQHGESPMRLLDEGEERLLHDKLIAEDRESSVKESRSKSRTLESDVDSRGTDSMTDSESDKDTDSEDEMRRKKLAQKQRIARRKEAADLRATAARSTINERKLLVEKLEKELTMLERISAEREEQQERDAAQLHFTVRELQQALELEKKSHNSTRMKAMARESELENQNAEIAKSLGALQWDLEEQISQVLKIKSVIEDKESTKAELERKLAKICNLKDHSKEELFVARSHKYDDYSFEKEQSDLWKRIQAIQIQVKDLEVKINSLKHTRHVPTQTEVEFEAHLAQLTDHIIQKQAQVEALATEKATLLIRLEAISSAIKEEEAIASCRTANKGARKNLVVDINYSDMEDGRRRLYGPKGKSALYYHPESLSRVSTTVSSSLSPLLGQLNSVFSVGVSYLRRHRWAQGLAVVYIVSLHLWVLFILFMNSKASQRGRLDEMGLPKNLSQINEVSNLTNLL